MPFLDAHFKVGNALLGTTPKLLAKNIPDAAFTVLTGDDREWTAKLKKRNKTERNRDVKQLMLDASALAVDTAALALRARSIDDQAALTLAAARQPADAWRRFESDEQLQCRRLVADAWCAAFVQPKTKDAGPGITYDTLRRTAEDPDSVPERVRSTVAELARRYRFFHWHLEFPTIFTVPGPGDEDVDPATGWRGGFSCVVGNPPWRRCN